MSEYKHPNIKFEPKPYTITPLPKKKFDFSDELNNMETSDIESTITTKKEELEETKIKLKNSTELLDAAVNNLNNAEERLNTIVLDSNPSSHEIIQQRKTIINEKQTIVDENTKNVDNLKNEVNKLTEYINGLETLRLQRRNIGFVHKNPLGLKPKKLGGKSKSKKSTKKAKKTRRKKPTKK